jgi:hypothetical protein
MTQDFDTNTVIANWLAPNDAGLRSLLGRCGLSLLDDSLGKHLIVKCSQVPANRLLDLAENLNHALLGRVIEVSLHENDGNSYSLPIGGAIASPTTVCDNLEKSDPRLIAIVRMSDDVGLKCTTTHGQYGKLYDTWEGTNLSQFHFPKKLAEYKNALLGAGQISSNRWNTITYEYPALDGAGNLILKTVESHLILFDGVLCRCVLTLNHEHL